MQKLWTSVENLDPGRREQIMEMLETVLIAKFPKLSGQEAVQPQKDISNQT